MTLSFYATGGVSGFPRGHKKVPQHEPRGNGSHPPDPKDQAPGPIQANNVRATYGEQGNHE